MGKIISWFKNYWYYYKWPVIIISFFAAVILFCIFSDGNKTEYDVSILYTGPCFITADEKDEMMSAFAQVMTHDKNGDGDKNAEIIDMPAFTDEQIKTAMDGEEDKDGVLYAKYAPYIIKNVENGFSQQFMGGVSSICLLDPLWYGRVYDREALLPLEDILGYKPEKLIDEYSVYFKDLPFAQWFGIFDKLPDDTILCFRKATTAASFTGKDKAVENYEAGKQMLRDIFAFSN